MVSDAWETTGVQTKALRELYSGDSTAKLVFHDLARRRRNYTETSVDRMAQRIQRDRRAVIRVFRKLEEAGCGEFIVGRSGYKSRFIWHVEMISVGKYAAGQEAPIGEVDLTEPPEPEDGDLEEVGSERTSNVIQHSFQLRPDTTVVLRLPADITAGEAARLADFVKALPF